MHDHGDLSSDATFRSSRVDERMRGSGDLWDNRGQPDPESLESSHSRQLPVHPHPVHYRICEWIIGYNRLLTEVTTSKGAALVYHIHCSDVSPLGGL